MFKKARIKLTAWYLLIIMVISLSFSTVIYAMVSQEIVRFAGRVNRFRIEQQYREYGLPPPQTGYSISTNEIEIIEESKKRLLINLFFINGLILISSGVLAYLLAGRTLSPINEMLNEQNRFISDSSHELRTPLTALKSAIEVFLRDKKPRLTDAKLLMADSLEQVNQLQSLSDDLLTLARYEKPNQSTLYESINLHELSNNLIKKIKPIADIKNIKIINNFQDVNIVANKQSLGDLLVILLENAIKYSPDGTQIDFNSEKTDGSIKLSVSDQGIGIDQSDLPHIFERFYRANTARTKSGTKGYGLGLSIAKKIVESHNGSIHVEKNSPKGTVFIVKIPLNQPRKFAHKFFS